MGTVRTISRGVTAICFGILMVGVWWGGLGQIVAAPADATGSPAATMGATTVSEIPISPGSMPAWQSGKTVAERQALYDQARATNREKLQGELARRTKASSLIVVKELKGHADGVWAVQFSPDGKLLASASADKTVRLWEVATGKELKRLEGHSDLVSAVAFSPDGKILVSGGADEQAIAWDVATGEIQEIWKQPSVVQNVAFLPEGKKCVVGANDVLTLLEVGEETPIRQMKGDASIECLMVTKDGRVVTGDMEGTVTVWNPDTGEKLLTRSRPQGDITEKNFIQSIHSLENGELLIADGERTWRWNLKSEAMVELLQRPGFKQMPVDGEKAILCATGSTIEFVGVTEALAWSWNVQGMIHSLAMSPSGEYLAVAAKGSYGQGGWQSPGPTDVVIYSVPAMLKLAKEKWPVGMPERERPVANGPARILWH